MLKRSERGSWEEANLQIHIGPSQATVTRGGQFDMMALGVCSSWGGRMKRGPEERAKAGTIVSKVVMAAVWPAYAVGSLNIIAFNKNYAFKLETIHVCEISSSSCTKLRQDRNRGGGRWRFPRLPLWWLEGVSIEQTQANSLGRY